MKSPLFLTSHNGGGEFDIKIYLEKNKQNVPTSNSVICCCFVCRQHPKIAIEIDVEIPVAKSISRKFEYKIPAIVPKTDAVDM